MAQVLLIDDDPAVRSVLRDVLKHLGHHVFTAVDGNLGLARATKNSLDLVITDIVMPDKEGLEVILELRRDLPEVKIIAISGGGERIGSGDYLELAKQFGAHRVLRKPFRIAELHQTLDELLNDG